MKTLWDDWELEIALAKIDHMKKEFWKYFQVRAVAMVIGFMWTAVAVDLLGFSGVITALLYLVIISPLIFLLHKVRGAKF